MNRLNKIVILFVLPFFCLLVSVSNAEYTEVPTSSATITKTTTSTKIGGYTITQIKNFFNTTDTSARDSMLNTVYEAGYNVIWMPHKNDLSGWWTIIYPKDSNFDIGGYISDSGTLYIEIYINKDDVFYYAMEGTASSSYKATCSKSGNYDIYNSCNFKLETFNSMIAEDNKVFGNIPYLKTLKYNSGYYWNGTDYYYEAPKEEQPDEELTLPSNSEIAQAVQNFYDSDYYKNNKDFKDFIVVYNYKTKYFDFIGHNFEDKIDQQIFPAGYKYNQQWWRFNFIEITSQLSSYLTNKYYWLYSTNNFGENITYEGKGAIRDLLDLHFSTSSIIVYSTVDYDVVSYEYNEEGEFVGSEMGTIPGDQYTYDENLDPTTNEYDPLTNFIPTNPSQNILGNIDFDEINKTFEENKNILNIENASWLFTANNKLVGYFIGFLSLLIVFLIISRILGG